MTRWDHIVPVANHGATVLGNMVLACSSCDDSKSQRSFDEWMHSDTPKSPRGQKVANVAERIEHIRAYVREFDYEPASIEAGMDEVERERLRAIRGRLASLRQEVDSLVSDFRRRTLFR